MSNPNVNIPIYLNTEEIEDLKYALRQANIHLNKEAKAIEDSKFELGRKEHINLVKQIERNTMLNLWLKQNCI